MIPPLFSGLSIPCHKSPVINNPIEHLNEDATKAFAQSQALTSNKSPQDFYNELAQIGTSPQELVSFLEPSGITDEYDNIPLYEKISDFSNKKIHILFANAMDEDPYISSGARQLAEFGEEILYAFAVIRKACGVQKSKILLCDRFLLENEIKQKHYGIFVQRMYGKYPLMSSVERKYGKKGYGTIGVGALREFAWYVKNRQNIRRTVITVSGENIINPKNILVNVGTPVAEILNFTGIKDEQNIIFAKGVFNTEIIKDTYSYKVKADTRAVTALNEQSIPQKEPSPCCGCGNCVSVCHKKLMPYYIVKAYERADSLAVKSFYPEECDGCGACTINCPAMINVAEIISNAKV